KGLNGSYRDGTELAETAITLRDRLKCSDVDMGMSWSVCGEVYRYAQRFHKAWDAYKTAEALFTGAGNWDWLGLLYQEQAICLYQALQDKVALIPNQLTEAKRLISKALDICPTNAIRAYPSALNRAGRIFAHDDPEQGLDYLKEGISE